MRTPARSLLRPFAATLAMLFIAGCGGGGGGGGGGGPPPTAPGRNDTIATATPLPLGNATFAGSISPSGHPNTIFAPDEDYYRIRTQGPLRVAIDINAQVNGSPLDSVIEFVDASGVALNSCVAPAFIDPCISDDEVLGVQLDSSLEIRINAVLGATFYLHVVDFRGDARPDLLYDMVMSISN